MKQPSLSLDAEARREQDLRNHKLITTAIAGELDELDFPNWFVNLSKCGSKIGDKTCKDCGRVHPLKYRCCLKFCPLCNWSITRERKIRLSAWASAIKAPMHLVLTQKNFDHLTKEKIREHQKNLARIRRNKVMQKVQGGCISVEITNENSWHLHSHWLIDARFVGMRTLAREWGQLVGQEYGIVHYNNSTDKTFVDEVTKYVIKGSEMASWPGHKMIEFINAIERRRFFFTFGSCFKIRGALAAYIEASLQREPKPCECGSTDLEVRASHFLKQHAFNAAKMKIESTPKQLTAPRCAL